MRPSGTYADPEIEGLYRTSQHYDRRARLWLIGGETALAGAAALFVWELTRPKGRPDNIPFEPEVRSLRAGGTGLGLRLAFLVRPLNGTVQRMEVAVSATCCG